MSARSHLPMNNAQDLSYPEIREAVQKLCAQFPGAYWQSMDRDRSYPTEFVNALTQSGFLSVLIPEHYGGSGLGLAAAAAVLEEIHRSGGNGGACHAQMYTMGTLLRHGSVEQKEHFLPKIASGELRLQAFGVTEPTSGTDTTRITTFARREGDHYVVSGQKIWTSRAEHSDLLVLLVRTQKREEAARPSKGLSVLLVDMRDVLGNGLTVRPIRTMLNHGTTELFFDEMIVPASSLIGEEGEGFKYILDGMNAERVLIASECIGDGRFFIDRAAAYAGERSVFDRPIGLNQGIQFPIARSYMSSRQQPAWLIRRRRYSMKVNPAGLRPTWLSCWRQRLAGRPRTFVCKPTVGLGSLKNTTLSASSARRVFTKSRLLVQI